MSGNKLTHETGKPWDARLAAWLIKPLIDSPVHPNALTTIRLVVGLAGSFVFALGEHFNVAALLIVASNFLDHTDGELARYSGKMSVFGHRYDLASDALVTIGMFVGIGIGLSSFIGAISLAMGAAAGLAVAGIFHLRNQLENAQGKSATKQPAFMGLEAEDVLYLIPLVTMSEQLPLFLKAASIGAPVALIIVYIDYRARTKNP
ncbi:MAG: CDP-alcohol phosphatidyltransferase family protein [Gammaproteobacteria bacterium]